MKNGFSSMPRILGEGYFKDKPFFKFEFAAYSIEEYLNSTSIKTKIPFNDLFV